MEQQFLFHSTRYQPLAPNAASNQTSRRISMGNGDARQDLLESRSEPLPGDIDRARSRHAVFALESFFVDQGRKGIEFEFSLRGFISEIEDIKVPNLGGHLEGHALAIQSALATLTYAQKCFTLSEDLARSKDERHKKAFVNYIAEGRGVTEGAYDDASIRSGQALIDASYQAEFDATTLLENAKTCHALIMNALNDLPQGKRAEGLVLIADKIWDVVVDAEKAIQVFELTIASTALRVALASTANSF